MEKEKEQVNHPSHYNREGKKECIIEMRERFGDVATGIFCLLNAFKYEYRAGAKDDEQVDRKKIEWYQNYFKSLLDDINVNRVAALDKFVEMFDDEFEFGD